MKRLVIIMAGAVCWLAELSAWWRQPGDPLLPELIAAAQAVSPTVAATGSRIGQARAARAAAGAAPRAAQARLEGAEAAWHEARRCSRT